MEADTTNNIGGVFHTQRQKKHVRKILKMNWKIRHSQRMMMLQQIDQMLFDEISLRLDNILELYSWRNQTPEAFLIAFHNMFTVYWPATTSRPSRC